MQNSIEVLADPQIEANGYVQQLADRAGAPFTLVTTPVQFGESPSLAARAPGFNEHGDQILSDLGLEVDRVLELKIDGVVA